MQQPTAFSIKRILNDLEDHCRMNATRTKRIPLMITPFNFQGDKDEYEAFLCALYDCYGAMGHRKEYLRRLEQVKCCLVDEQFVLAEAPEIEVNRKNADELQNDALDFLQQFRLQLGTESGRYNEFDFMYHDFENEHAKGQEQANNVAIIKDQFHLNKNNANNASSGARNRVHEKAMRNGTRTVSKFYKEPTLTIFK